MTLRRVARPRLLASHCLLETSRGCFREIALFPILLFFRFALRFRHGTTCHTSTPSKIPNFKLTHYRISPDRKQARVLRRRSIGNAVLLGKFSDELEKETNSNQRDSEATAPTHKPRMPDRSP